MSAAPKSPKGYALIIGIAAIIFFVAGAVEQLEQQGTPVSLPVINTTQDKGVHEYYKVTKVVDGDTLQIDMNGTLEKVRLIGINTPETVDPRKPVQCFGKEASARMKELAQGKLVYLEFDDTQQLRDTYDRLLAYVYLEDGQMLNRKMIAEGYAYEYTYMTPYKYQKEFRELVNFARRSEVGLWSSETCDGKK